VSAQQDLFVSMLARKHPVPFFQFLDRCARSGQLDADCSLQVMHLAANGSCRVGTKGLADLLSSPAATAALGSALCSILKLCVQNIGMPDAGRAGVPADEHESNKLTMRMLCAVAVVKSVLLPLSSALAAAVPGSSSSSSSSSSRAEQMKTSTTFLLVLISRGLLAVHEAAAGVPGAAAAGLGPAAAAAGGASLRTAGDVMVHQSMFSMLHVFYTLWELPIIHEMPAAAAAAVAAATEAGSSSSKPVRWQYLLRLHESRKLAAAAVALHKKWGPTAREPLLESNRVYSDDAAAAVANAAGVSSTHLLGLRQLYQDVLGYCSTLIAVAPLPVVCNNPGCGELSGVSEAAAACYVCAGCGCRYCSAACQAAGWRSHKKACRHMAACGLRVDGKQQLQQQCQTV
jgi:hypothetical protein